MKLTGMQASFDQFLRFTEVKTMCPLHAPLL